MYMCNLMITRFDYNTKVSVLAGMLYRCVIYKTYNNIVIFNMVMPLIYK